MAVIKAVSSKAGIGQALDYVTKEEKTEDKLVSGLHCEPDTVKDEMQATKELWEKTGGRTYKHFVQSYHKDEKITPEQAHRNALQLAENTSAWKGFEVLVATHKDKKHIHTHFIVNSVNFEDGHKLQWSSADLQELKERCNAQSREQGLHVSEKGKTFEGAEREETVAWKKETYQLLKQAEQGKVKSYVQDIALADKVVDAVKSGAIKKFVVMAGCDGRSPARNYYTDFAKALPQDTVILTAGCAKYKYNKLPLGDIGGIPRVLDAGQCNDSYSLALIALKLKEVFGLNDINQLPIVYNIAWYEQKAVIVLLALLSLGVKNIHLGPTLPAFLSPNVAKVLIENFGIAGITDVDTDLEIFFGKN